MYYSSQQSNQKEAEMFLVVKLVVDRMKSALNIPIQQKLIKISEEKKSFTRNLAVFNFLVGDGSRLKSKSQFKKINKRKDIHGQLKEGFL